MTPGAAGLADRGPAGAAHRRRRERGPARVTGRRRDAHHRRHHGREGQSSRLGHRAGVAVTSSRRQDHLAACLAGRSRRWRAADGLPVIGRRLNKIVRHATCTDHLPECMRPAVVTACWPAVMLVSGGVALACAGDASGAGHPARALKPSGPKFFNTIKPGKKLPSGAQCAKWVLSRPLKENKGVNRKYNHTKGQHDREELLHRRHRAANKVIAPRVNGELQRHHGRDPALGRLQVGHQPEHRVRPGGGRELVAADHQGRLVETNGCPPGHGPGVDGMPGQCPQSWGILQNRYPFETVELAGHHEVHRDERRPGLRDLAHLLRRLRDLAQHGAARRDLQGRGRLGLRRALVRRPLAHQAGPGSTSRSSRST